ncbi:M23 family metallopeptidase [Sphingosinicella sp.]|uniref:M23 family metallopeptidase n=1 Tax=Sphingosinicella sp. TaxID=1917971 RepID=UPI004037B0CE
MTGVRNSLFLLLFCGSALAAQPWKPDDGPSEAEIDAALGRSPPTPSGMPSTPSITPSGLAIPVVGIPMARLTDTFSASRGGGARRHNAIDIMAPRGTPVVAAADGVVERLHASRGLGGITAYVRSVDGAWTYYYAHLDGYAPGLQQGQRIRRGDPIGFVGSTGNASATAPHLHFAISRMGPADRWWQGTPVNPYPLLAGRMASR